MRTVDSHDVVRSEQRHALLHRADSSRRELAQTLATFEAPLQRVNRFQQRLRTLRPLLPTFAFLFAALTVLRLVLRLLRSGPPREAAYPAQRSLPGAPSRGPSQGHSTPRGEWLFRIQQLVNAFRLGMQVYALARASMLLATAPALPRRLDSAKATARDDAKAASPEVSRWENEGGGSGRPSLIGTNGGPASRSPHSSLPR